MKPNFISNSKLKLLRKLNRKKYRFKEQLFFVEGIRAVQQILENQKLEVSELFFDEGQQLWQEKWWQSYLNTVGASMITAKEFIAVSDTDNPQGVIALCQMPSEADLETLAREQGIVLATDAIQDPGNLGTIIRTATWFGAKGLVCGKGTVDVFNPKVVRSTAGATGTICHMNAKLSDVLPMFKAKGWQIVVLDAGADSMPIKKFEKQKRIVLVIGNEANGIRPVLLGSGQQKIRIDSPKGESNVESLNAAVACSIALHELT